MTDAQLCGKCQKPKGLEEGCCKCGRPTLYDPAFCDRVQEYIDTCGVSRENGVVFVNLPKLEGFAKFLKVNRSSLHLWSQTYPEFSHALDLIKSEQKSRLIDYGLAGTFNSTISKLILSSDHGVREKSEQDLNVKDGAGELARAMLRRGANGSEPVEDGSGETAEGDS